MVHVFVICVCVRGYLCVSWSDVCMCMHVWCVEACVVRYICVGTLGRGLCAAAHTECSVNSWLWRPPKFTGNFRSFLGPPEAGAI